MSKVVFNRLYQHGDNTFMPHVEYDEKEIPEILKGFAVPVKEVKASPKKKSKGTSKK